MMGTYHRVGWFRQPGKKEQILAMNSLETVGMSDLKDRQIGELSGGQRQRVFLARSLAQEAEIFLMDEPFAGIDTRTEDMLLEVFHDLQRAGKTLIVVHHDLGTVRDRFQNAILLQRKLIASGPVSDVLTSEILSQAYDGGAIPEVG
jgi:manganese/zinc/iron transport system ATP- binding protein